MNSQWNLDNLTLTSEASTCWITEVVTLWIIHGIACNGGGDSDSGQVEEVSGYADSTGGGSSSMLIGMYVRMYSAYHQSQTHHSLCFPSRSLHQCPRCAELICKMEDHTGNVILQLCMYYTLCYVRTYVQMHMCLHTVCLTDELRVQFTGILRVTEYPVKNMNTSIHYHVRKYVCTQSSAHQTPFPRD